MTRRSATLTVLGAMAGATGCSRPGAKIQTVELPGSSPLVSFRLVFLTGAAADPPGKEGLANLTAAMLANGGTRDRTYKELLDAFFPMATGVSAQVDKEMTTFAGVTHIDNLEAFYALFRAMLLEPGWRAGDLERLRDESVNFLRVGLRGNNDEELGKEVLYNALYASHPYGRQNTGTVAGLKAITLEDCREFYRTHFTQANLIAGLGGGYPSGFADRLRKDFAGLAESAPALVELPQPPAIPANRLLMIEKNTRPVAFSLGYPIDVTRAHADYPALLVAQSYFGQHRNSAGRLFQRIREVRGINYGDYAYIEYFPRGMFQFAPDPNLGRHQQIFQIWIRPVERAAAGFTLRLALYELKRLTDQGLTKDEFENTRQFLSKFVNVLTKTKDAELGYAIDSQFYQIPPYTQFVKDRLSKLSVDDVNQAIRRHLRAGRLQIVAVANDCAALRDELLSGKPTPMSYNSPKPAEILAEDRIVESFDLGLDRDRVQIVPVSEVFERSGPLGGS